METSYPDAVKRHMDICTEINTTYAQKNEDYGDSFHLLFLQEGLTSSRIRLGDKYNRFCTLTRRNEEEQMVKTESIRDTLIDMAGYAIQTVMELDRMKEEDKKSTQKLNFPRGGGAYM